MTAPIAFQPIGYVRTPASVNEVKTGWEELVSEIEILKEYEDGLEAIDGFSHLLVLTHLHEVPEEARSSTLLVKPRGLLRFGLTLEELPTVGVFACDSPVRPNAIGVSVVRALGRERRILRVRGLDAFDGTPVLDLKPYGPDRIMSDVTVPDWHDELTKKAGGKRV